MRRLELEVLKQLRSLTKSPGPTFYISEIDVDFFYGIEYEEFPAQIATIALMDHRPHRQQGTVHRVRCRTLLPLKKNATRAERERLEIGLEDGVSNEGNETETTLYILGNRRS